MNKQKELDEAWLQVFEARDILSEGEPKRNIYDEPVITIDADLFSIAVSRLEAAMEMLHDHTAEDMSELEAMDPITIQEMKRGGISER